MALTSYTKTPWVNDSAPARNATNLNNQESGIFNVTEEVIAQDGRITDNETATGTNATDISTLQTDVTGNTSDIAALAALSNIYGALRGGSTIGTLTPDTYALFDNYTQEKDLFMPTDLVNGTIEVPTSGTYRVTMNIVANFNTIGNAKEDIFLGVFDGANVNTDLVDEIQDFLGKDSEAGSFYPSILFDAVAGRQYRLGIKSSDNLQGLSYSLVSFDITSVHRT